VPSLVLDGLSRFQALVSLSKGRRIQREVFYESKGANRE
jgi:hypothetical protein